MRRCDVEGMFSSPLYFAIVRREMFSPSFLNIQRSVSSDSGHFLSSSEMKFCSVTRGNALRLSSTVSFPSSQLTVASGITYLVLFPLPNPGDGMMADRGADGVHAANVNIVFYLMKNKK